MLLHCDNSYVSTNQFEVIAGHTQEFPEYIIKKSEVLG